MGKSSTKTKPATTATNCTRCSNELVKTITTKKKKIMRQLPTPTSGKNSAKIVVIQQIYTKMLLQIIDFTKTTKELYSKKKE